MAATVGDLVVKLGAVTSKYESKMKSARGTNTKFGASVTGINTKLRNMGATAARVASGALTKLTSGLGNITRKALGFATALLGVSSALGAAGLGLTLKKRLEDMDALGKTSRKLGTTTEELSKLAFAAEQTAGVDFRTFSIGLQRMTRRIAEVASTDRGQAKPILEILGLDAPTLGRKSPVQAFLDIADAMQKIPSQGERIRLTFGLFDTEGVNLVNTLSEGRAELEGFGRELEQVGGVLTDDMTAGAEAANDAMNRFRVSLGGLATQAATELSPFVEIFADDLTSALTNAKSSTSELIGEFGLLGGAIISATQVLQPLLVMALRLDAFALKAQARTLRLQATVEELTAEPPPLGQRPLPSPKRAQANELGAQAAAFTATANALENRDLAEELAARVRAARAPVAPPRPSRDLRGFDPARFGVHRVPPGTDIFRRGRGLARPEAGMGPRRTSEQQARLTRDANALRQSLLTPQQKTLQEAARIQAMFRRNAISDETRRKGLEALKVPVADRRAADVPRFAGAIEKGGAGTFSAVLATLKRDPKNVEKQIEKNTAKTNTQIDKLIDAQPVVLDWPGQ